MCGIFGIVGSKPDAAQQVFKGLTDIEYRGYDSWGVAYFTADSFHLTKKVGFLPPTYEFPLSKLAIGHTRWATHGGVTESNSHPHVSCDNKLVLVHNGIVENYLELKKELKNHKLKSETDSEVIIHLIEDQMQKKDFKRAVADVFNRLEGLSAIVVSNGKEIIACKIGSPLVVGQTKEGFVIASDPNALLPLTKKLIFLEDGQMVVLNSKLSMFEVKNLKEMKANFTVIDWEYAKSDMEKFPHFMLKEIYEQPHVLYNQIQSLDSVEKIVEEIKNSFGTYFLGGR